MRLFLAITLTAPLVETLSMARARLLDVAPQWRGEKWVRSTDLHMTLRFFGDLDPEAEGLSPALRAACSAVAPYRLVLGGARAVPNGRSARMIWADFREGTQQTAELAESIEHAARALGATAAERPFRAHVTLCRARKPRQLPGDALTALQSALHAVPEGARAMSVREITLFSSTLTPAGPDYRALTSYALDGD